MTRIKTRLQTWSAMAALGTIASLAIPAVSAWAEAAEPTALAAVERPSFASPQVTFIQGLGWEIDSGGPALQMRYLGDDD